jgi:hypothetical protein
MLAVGVSIDDGRGAQLSICETAVGTFREATLTERGK